MFATPKTERDKEVKTLIQPAQLTQYSYIERFNGSLNYIENLSTFASSYLELF